MQIDESSDGVEEALLHAVHLQMEIARAVGRAGNKAIHDRLREQRRRDRNPRYRQRQERKERRAEWKREKQNLKGVGRDSWWENASPAKVVQAALTAEKFRDSKLRARIAGWSMNRKYKQYFGVPLDETMQAFGHQAPQRDVESTRLAEEVVGLGSQDPAEARRIADLHEDLSKMYEDPEYQNERLGLESALAQEGPVREAESADRSAPETETAPDTEQGQEDRQGGQGQEGRDAQAEEAVEVQEADSADRPASETHAAAAVQEAQGPQKVQESQEPQPGAEGAAVQEAGSAGRDSGDPEIPEAESADLPALEAVAAAAAQEGRDNPEAPRDSEGSVASETLAAPEAAVSDQENREPSPVDAGPHPQQSPQPQQAEGDRSGRPDPGAQPEPQVQPNSAQDFLRRRPQVPPSLATENGPKTGRDHPVPARGPENRPRRTSVGRGD